MHLKIATKEMDDRIQMVGKLSGDWGGGCRLDLVGFLLLLNQPNPCDHIAEGELCRRRMYRERIETRGEEDKREEGETSQKQSNENINESFLCIAGCSQGCKVLCKQIILKMKFKYCAMDFSFKNSLHIPPNF